MSDFYQMYPDKNCFSSTKVEVLGKTPLFIFDRVEYTKDNGILVYYKGCKHPQHGFPFMEAVAGIGTAKRAGVFLLKSASIYKLWKNRSIIIADYNRLCEQALFGMYMKDEFLTPMALQIKRFLKKLEEELKTTLPVEAITHIFQYDDAYRYFLQDLIDDYDADDLIRFRTYGEIIKKIKSRNKTSGAHKFIPVIKIFRLLTIIPSLKKKLKSSLDVIDFRRIKMDECDRYWVLSRNDYDFFGLSFEQRSVMWLHENKNVQPPVIFL